MAPNEEATIEPDVNGREPDREEDMLEGGGNTPPTTTQDAASASTAAPATAATGTTPTTPNFMSTSTTGAAPSSTISNIRSALALDPLAKAVEPTAKRVGNAARLSARAGRGTLRMLSAVVPFPMKSIIAVADIGLDVAGKAVKTAAGAVTAARNIVRGGPSPS